MVEKWAPNFVIIESFIKGEDRSNENMHIERNILMYIRQPLAGVIRDQKVIIVSGGQIIINTTFTLHRNTVISLAEKAGYEVISCPQIVFPKIISELKYGRIKTKNDIISELI